MHAWKGYEPPSERETGPLACNLFFATHFFLRSFTSIVFRAVQGSSMPVDPKANTGAPPHHHSPMCRPHRPGGGGGKSLPHHLRFAHSPHGAEAGLGMSSASARKASNYVEYCRPVPSSSIPQPLTSNPCGHHEVPVHVQGIASWRSRSRTAFQKMLSGRTRDMVDLKCFGPCAILCRQ